MEGFKYELNFSHKLKAYRERHGISPMNIAEWLCMSKSNYYKIERGVRKISPLQLITLVKKGKMSSDEFLNVCGVSIEKEQPAFLIVELFAKLILTKKGLAEAENVSYDDEEEKFMESFIRTFLQKKSKNKS